MPSEQTILRRPGSGPLMDLVAFAEMLLAIVLEPKQRELLEKAGKRTLVNCARQWGKSMLAAVALLWHALSNPHSTALIAGPGERQTAELLERIRGLTRRMGMGRLPTDGVNRHSLRFPNGARVVALPGNANTIRGFSGVSMLVIDEAAVTKDEIYPAVRPMLTQKRGTIWIISTPHGTDGFFAKEWHDGGEEWERVSVPATECERFTPEMLAEEREALGAKRFAQEFLCEFVSIDEGMFESAWLEAMLTDEIGPLELQEV